MGKPITNSVDKEVNSILLEDARQSYYSRMSNFSNLSSKAGILIASIIGIVTISVKWFSNLDSYIVVKLLTMAALVYAIYLAQKSLFINELEFFSIKKARKNIEENPSIKSDQWITFMVDQYSKMSDKAHTVYDNRNKDLIYSFGLIVISITVILFTK